MSRPLWVGDSSRSKKCTFQNFAIFAKYVKVTYCLFDCGKTTQVIAPKFLHNVVHNLKTPTKLQTFGEQNSSCSEMYFQSTKVKILTIFFEKVHFFERLLSTNQKGDNIANGLKRSAIVVSVQRYKNYDELISGSVRICISVQGVPPPPTMHGFYVHRRSVNSIQTHVHCTLSVVFTVTATLFLILTFFMTSLQGLVSLFL